MDPTIAPPNNNRTTAATMASGQPRRVLLLNHPRMRNRNSPEQGRNLYARYYNLRNRDQQTSHNVILNIRSTVAGSNPLLRVISNTESHPTISINNGTIIYHTNTNGPQRSQNPTTTPLRNSANDRIQTQMSLFLNSDLLRENIEDMLYLDRPAHGLTIKEIEKNTITYDYKPVTKHPRLTRMSSRNNIVGNNNEENESCCICLNRFCSRFTLRRLPCLHVFHCKCVDKWLQNNKRCPICRISIKINYEDLLQSLEGGNSIETILKEQDARPDLSARERDFRRLFFNFNRFYQRPTITQTQTNSATTQTTTTANESNQ